MKTTFFSEFLKGAKQAPRIYFAPVIGAINEVRAELARIDAEGSNSAPPSNITEVEKSR